MSDPAPSPQAARIKARGHTVVPFPQVKESSLEWKVIRWHKGASKPDEIPASIAPPFSKGRKNIKLVTRHCSLRKIRKSCIRASELPGNFNMAKREAIVQIETIFSNLEDQGIFAGKELLEKLHSELSLGNICSTSQINAFVKKAKTLADCIELYLRKQDYSEEFSKEIPYETFEDGFSKEEQAAIEREFPNYFSDNP